MKNPAEIADDITRIQENLAGAVSKAILAGKVTSTADLAHILAVGRAVADLDHVAGDILELEYSKLVAYLAELDEEPEEEPGEPGEEE